MQPLSSVEYSNQNTLFLLFKHLKINPIFLCINSIKLFYILLNLYYPKNNICCLNFVYLTCYSEIILSNFSIVAANLVFLKLSFVYYKGNWKSYLMEVLNSSEFFICILFLVSLYHILDYFNSNVSSLSPEVLLYKNPI